jgi:group I intron endonuclease
MSKQYPGGTCVYSITNKVNGMQYIGVTANTKERFKAHCTPKSYVKSYVRSAIQHYGKDSFNFNVLVVADRRYCLELEAKLIETYNTLTPNGYNICGGGEGPVAALAGENHPWFGKTFTQEHRDKIGASHKGKKRSQELCDKLRAANIGKTISAEQRQKISKSLTGKKLTPEHCENMRQSMLGRFVSDETKRKMSEAAKALGPRSAETRLKISQTKKAQALAKRNSENQL